MRIDIPKDLLQALDSALKKLSRLKKRRGSQQWMLIEVEYEIESLETQVALAAIETYRSILEQEEN